MITQALQFRRYRKDSKKSDALDAQERTPGPNVRNDSDIAKILRNIETTIIDLKKLTILGRRKEAGYLYSK